MPDGTVAKSIGTLAPRNPMETERWPKVFGHFSPQVDLFQLQVNTLRRYKRHYKIQTRPGLNKAQLAEVRVLETIPMFYVS